MPRKDRQTEIFDATLKCIGRLGIEGTNALSISKELGVAQSGIFYHFPNKDVLFDSLIEYIAGVNHDIVEKLKASRHPKTTLEALKIHIEGNFIWAQKYPDHVAALLMGIIKTSRSKVVKTLMVKLMQVGEDRIYQYLAEGKAEGEFEVSGSLRSIASIIHKSLTGFLVSYHYSRSREKSTGYFLSLMDEELAFLIKSSRRDTC